MTNPYLAGSVVESPVGLIVSEAGGRVNAMTASFFSEVSHYPTSLWVSIHKGSLTHEMVQESGRFSLIVLQHKQREIALACGTVSGRDRDKARGLALYRGREDFLYLDGALASVACRVSRTRDLGDHTLFLAAILAGEFDTRQSIRRHLLTTDLR